MFLLADIGGTNARFALADKTGQITQTIKLLAGDFATSDAAFAAALDRFGNPKLEGAYVAWAGPVVNGSAHLTNRDGWHLDHATLAKQTGARDVKLVNDFVAQVRAIPALNEDQRRTILNGDDIQSAPFVVIGPGTGLGIGVMSARDGSGQILAGEGGHVTLPARTEEEAALIKIASRDLDHISAERFVSGGELNRLYECVAALANQTVDKNLSGAQIATLAKSGDAIAQKTINHFTDFLGTIAADLAVTCGAQGGVWLTGDLLKSWQSDGLFEEARLIKRFTDKGRFSDYCARCGLYQNVADDPAFIGLAEFIPR